jgi:hypothetical protein
LWTRHVARVVGEGTFTSVVNGHRQSKHIVPLSFGSPVNGNQPPAVALELVPSASPLVAPASIVLKASASDADGRVAKVAFYEGCDKIGESIAAPYRLSVSSLSPPEHTSFPPKRPTTRVPRTWSPARRWK